MSEVTIPAQGPVDVNVSDWMPIKTAPKDGTKILGYFPEEGYDLPMVMPCLFDDGAWQFDIYEAPYREAKPSHWIPLPAPPSNFEVSGLPRTGGNDEKER